MATYFVASGGSNTAPYDTWAKAATSLQTALTAASTAGDVVVVQYNAVPSGDAEVAADVIYTFAADVALFSGSNDGASDWTPTPMWSGSGDPANWIGHSTSNRSIAIAGAFHCYIKGVTFRTAGSSADNMRLSATAAGARYYEDCYFWNGNSNTASDIQLGPSTAGQSYTHLRGCVVRFGGTGQSFQMTCGMAVIEEVITAGSAITALVSSAGGGVAGVLKFSGCDFSSCASGASLVQDATVTVLEVDFVRCKLPSSYVALDTQTDGMAAARVFIRDSASGDTQGRFEYHDAFGSVVTDSANYLTAGAAGMSWKITTTARASKAWPFRSPWIDLYNTGTSAVTPYLEFLRNNGTASAYTDQQVWAQFSVKDVSGSAQSSLYSDRNTSYTAAGTAQAAGTGTGSWTIASSSSPYSMKCDSGAAVTPAETGHLRARVCVAEPSIAGTLYVDPQIRV